MAGPRRVSRLLLVPRNARACGAVLPLVTVTLWQDAENKAFVKLLTAQNETEIKYKDGKSLHDTPFAESVTIVHAHVSFIIDVDLSVGLLGLLLINFVLASICFIFNYYEQCDKSY